MDVSTTLLATKLYVPSLRAALVARPRLVARLADGLTRPLTLVSAPAGFGKTTLIGEWHSSPAGRSFPLAWLSLDPGDNDPTRFLIHLAASIQTQRPDLGLTALALLHAAPPQSARPAAVLTSLINDLTQLQAPLALVLDDYHLITAPPVHEAVTFLLDHLPPQVHLILLTRADPPLPLGRLRARAQLAELRTADLRFTADEASTFLEQTMRLRLAPAQVAALEARTEGWIAGLQLAALALQGRADPAAFIQALSGSERFVLEYLLDEVLGRQPPEIQNFLLRTSILERLCQDGCDCLMDRPLPGPVQLAALERMNLFLVPMDETGRWYRYHHLFASLLRAQLRQSVDPATLAELYRRASQWYESQGLLAEAIHQALAAPDRAYAAQLLEREILTFFYHSEITQVHRWLEALPAHLVRARPLLCAVQGAVIALLPPYPPQSLIAAEDWMRAAEQALPADPQAGGLPRAFIAAIRSYWARFRGEPADCVLQLIRQAQALLPADPRLPLDRNHLRLRSALHTNLGFALWDAGDEAAARQAFIEARALGRAADDLFNESAAAYMLAGMTSLRGELEAAARLCREALALLGRQHSGLGHRAPFSAEIGLELAEILTEQNELPEAEQLARDNLELAQWSASEGILVRGHLALARLLAARGDPAAAFENLAEAEKVSAAGEALTRAQRAMLWLALSDRHPEYRDLARQWGRGQALAEFGAGPPQMDWMVSLALARVRLAVGAAPVAVDLLPWLERQQRAMRARGWVLWEIRLSLLECLARHSAGDRSGALAALRQAVELSAPGGFVRLFVEGGPPLPELLDALAREPGALAPHVRRIRSALSDDAGRPDGAPPAAPAAVPAVGVEALTGRELEVLRLLCQGHSNQAIAARLFISLSTVKKHNYSLFGKLDVSTRAQAIVRARQLGLSR